MISMSSISPYAKRIALVTFLGLSVVLFVINQFFYIDDYIDHPQFERWNHWAYCIAEIIQSGHSALYVAYFILDTLWAASLLFLMYTVVTAYMVNKSMVKGTYFSVLANAIFVKTIFIATFSLDAIENALYLIFYIEPRIFHDILENIAMAKVLAYILIFVWFLWSAYREYKAKIGESKFAYRPGLYLKSMWISIAIMLVIVFLLTNMEQGASLIIALLDDPINLTLVLLLLYALYTILSHYPLYLFHRFFQPTGSQIKPNSWSILTDFWRFGIVYFDKNKMAVNSKMNESEIEEYKTNDINFTPYRKFMGGAIYLAFLYCLYFTYGKYYGCPVSITSLLGLFLFPLLIRILHRLLLDKLNDTYLTSYMAFLWFLKWSSLITGVSTIVLAFLHGWYWTTFWSAAVYFLSTGLSHVMTNSSTNNNEVENQNNRLKSDKWFNYFSHHVDNWRFKLKDYHDKLLFIKITGFLSLFIFLLAHCPHYAWRISPILILMSYLHLLYGIAILLVKYSAFAREYYAVITKPWKKTLALMAMYSILPVAAYLGYQQYFMMNKSDISFLNQVPTPSENEIITLDNFLKEKACNIETRYYIASWGGGLRATYFNFLMLNKLDQKTPGGLINKTVAMSGVSGGMLGLGFHFAATKEGGPGAAQIMDQIGAFNFVSTDLSYLLGRDQVPIKKRPGLRDRSITGMLNYWRIIKQNPLEQLDQTPYEKYWSDYVRQKYYPVIITNSTKSSGNYGVALSARPASMNAVLGGSTNMLKPQAGMTLPFLEALSTTERFPLFSATASIEGLGHFIDGGYFENSGLLSLMNFRKYARSVFAQNNCDVIDSNRIQQQEDKLLIIANSKDHYIARIIKDHFPVFPKIKIEGESDYASIGKGVLNTDRLGNHLQTYYELLPNDATLSLQIYALPYKVRYLEVLEVLGGQPQEIADIVRIREALKAKNKMIQDICDTVAQNQNQKYKFRSYSGKWDYIYPTLSRLLSRPSVNYYKALIERHPEL
ncbi:MAG: hypothetical protein IPH94_09495 [Saprospiraceae bacterium]|nr:hypothetical protein [Saprospiraceae bacterium]